MSLSSFDDFLITLDLIFLVCHLSNFAHFFHFVQIILARIPRLKLSILFSWSLGKSISGVTLIWHHHSLVHGDQKALIRRWKLSLSAFGGTKSWILRHSRWSNSSFIFFWLKRGGEKMMNGIKYDDGQLFFSLWRWWRNTIYLKNGPKIFWEMMMLVMWLLSQIMPRWTEWTSTNITWVGGRNIFDHGGHPAAQPVSTIECTTWITKLIILSQTQSYRG